MRTRTRGMKQRNFQMIRTNGVTLRTVVEGSGPLVILLHGFPQCWYRWRHQIDPLVTAGFQVAVPDQRGYAGSDKPAAIEAYNIVELSNDVAGIATALGHERFVVVGHDWGAPVAWHTALLHAKRVRAVVGMSVPYFRGVVGAMTRQQNFGNNFWYMVYFQQPGVAEAELEADIRKSLRMIYYSISGDAPQGIWFVPKPSTAKFLDGKIEQPALFIAGMKDLVLSFGGGTMIGDMEKRVPDLRGKVLVEGAGHWVQAEKPAPVNDALIPFLKATK